MLTYEDCIGLCELTEEEIRAISEHEHIPEIVAAELGAYLVRSSDGEDRIRRIILDDIRAAEARQDLKRAFELKAVLHHFMQHHPKNVLAAQN
ncbi:MAG: hypothetical protein GKS00_17295 [Alphaproteobacteria bacterium]|nr:hypothetical protein [Alphaproteobacteria bacterium]